MKILVESYQKDEQEITLSEEEYQIIDKRRVANLSVKSKSNLWD